MQYQGSPTAARPISPLPVCPTARAHHHGHHHDPNTAPNRRPSAPRLQPASPIRPRPFPSQPLWHPTHLPPCFARASHACFSAVPYVSDLRPPSTGPTPLSHSNLRLNLSPSCSCWFHAHRTRPLLLPPPLPYAGAWPILQHLRWPWIRTPPRGPAQHSHSRSQLRLGPPACASTAAQDIPLAAYAETIAKAHPRPTDRYCPHLRCSPGQPPPIYSSIRAESKAPAYLLFSRPRATHIVRHLRFHACPILGPDEPASLPPPHPGSLLAPPCLVSIYRSYTPYHRSRCPSRFSPWFFGAPRFPYTADSHTAR